MRGKSVACEARGRHTREISHTRDEGKACEGNQSHAKQGEDMQGKSATREAKGKPHGTSGHAKRGENVRWKTVAREARGPRAREINHT